MERSKKTMLAAALAVAVIAFAGVGYAAYADTHTAKTTTANSSLETTYLTITQDGAAKYDDVLTKLYYNTETVAGATAAEPVVKYIPRYTHKIDNNAYVAYTAADAEANTSGYALITDVFQLVLTNNNVVNTTASLTVKTTTLAGIQGLKYTMVLEDADSATSGSIAANAALTSDSSTGAWSFNSINLSSNKVSGSVTYNVYLFVSLDNVAFVQDTSPTSTIGTAGFASPTTFEFTAVVSSVTPNSGN